MSANSKLSTEAEFFYSREDEINLSLEIDYNENASLKARTMCASSILYGF